MAEFINSKRLQTDTGILNRDAFFVLAKKEKNSLLE
jgi:hypothetical protein